MQSGTGSLTLSIDSKGLRYRFEAPKTGLGDGDGKYPERRDRREFFCFDVEEETWEKKSDGTWKRTILKIDHLYDVAPVYNAAYSKTSVYMRGKEQAEEDFRKQEEQRKSGELDEYYENIEKLFNN